jgi:hypothetical protein
VDDHDWLAERFEAQRGHLQAVAYRMLGSLSEADDACRSRGDHLGDAVQPLVVAAAVVLPVAHELVEQGQLGQPDGGRDGTQVVAELWWSTETPMCSSGPTMPAP